MIKRRKHRPITLEQMRRSMATAVRELECIFLDTSNGPDVRTRAINSLASLANSYARITEVADLEERLAKLEESL